MSNKISTKKQTTKKNNEDIEKTQNKKIITKNLTKNNISEEDTQINDITDENNVKSNNNKILKQKILHETSERYLGIFYGGILKTTEFIIVKDECLKYGPNIYYKKIKSLYENRLNNNNKLEDNTKLKKITGVIFNVKDSDYLYEKFINFCDNPQEGCAENEKIYYQDINDMDDEILNNIHLIHSKNLGYIKDILNNICASENMQKSIEIYPKILRDSKPKVIKTTNPKKPSSKKTNIDDEIPIVNVNVKKTNNIKKNRKPVVIEENSDEENTDEENIEKEINKDELKNNEINESDDEVDEIKDDEDNEDIENIEDNNEEIEDDDE